MSEFLFGHAGSVFSEDQQYRYQLTRQWGSGGRLLTFVMLNPSTADATTDDPTIRRCKYFAARDGYDGIRIVNLYAYRATDPRRLRTVADPVGPENETWLRAASRNAFTTDCPIVCAWGNHADPVHVQAFTALNVARLVCLGVNQNGSPKHPLYIPNSRELTPWHRQEPA